MSRIANPDTATPNLPAKGEMKANGKSDTLSATNTVKPLATNVPLKNPGYPNDGFHPAVPPLGSTAVPPTQDQSAGFPAYYTEIIQLAASTRRELRIGARSLVCWLGVASDVVAVNPPPVLLYFNDNVTPVPVFPLQGFRFSMESFPFDKVRIETPAGWGGLGDYTLYLMGISRSVGFCGA